MPKEKKEKKVESIAPEETAAQPVSETPAKNVIFVGKREVKGEKVAKEAPRHIQTATSILLLPDNETQQKGFYHERADELIRLFPQLYKPIVPKG